MKGPEHYREAERLLNVGPCGSEEEAAATRQAQVHATLALAAAFAPMPLDGNQVQRMADWKEVAG